MELALFDFNGTVSHRQILVDFIRDSVHPLRLVAGVLFLWPVLVLYLAHGISNRAAKEICFTFFFGGQPEADVAEAARTFSQKKLAGLLDQTALEKISWHKSRGHTVVIVSGTIEPLLADWCRERGIDLIANRLEIRHGGITGRLCGVNCWGKGKVQRIREAYTLERFSTIYAYGNTRGDLDMLNLADERFMNRF